jgi:hypothetical protein
MDRYLAITLRAINQHGKNCTYTTVTEGTYNIETGATINTETAYTIKMYKRHVRANQYNFPNMIGRDSAVFYLANNNLSFVPAHSRSVQVSSLLNHL